MPGSAAGSRTRVIVSPLVAPMASEPSRMARGTAWIRVVRDREEMKGRIMMPITAPAASALLGEMAMPNSDPASRTAGATVRTAKKP